ncbi:MAG: hypothetical protein ABW217_04325, partial [Polyangiaceae bacterium]
GLEPLVRLLEQHCSRLRELGENPAIIVDKLRPHTQRIWRKLSLEDRLAFARKYSARWNVQRHRIAPEIHAQVASAQLTGQLRVHAGNIRGVVAAGARVRVLLEGGKEIEADLVVNATGPQTRFSATRSVLLQNLLRRGLVSSDDMDLGLCIDQNHGVIARDGEPSPLLLALGPMLRGTHWETIAVPELRGQARRVAETLLGLAPRSIAEHPVMMEFLS